MEIFGILSHDKESIIKAVHQGYHDLAAPYFTPKDGNHDIRIQAGTCPFSGREYLHIVMDNLREADFKAVQKMQADVYASHTYKDEPVVKDNMVLRIEDSECGGINESKIDQVAQDEDEITCWLCGRMDGEEYYDPQTRSPYNVEVQFRAVAHVPLCSVCLELLLSHDDWENK